MKHLTADRLGEEFDDLLLLPVDLWTDLPFKQLDSWHFSTKENDICSTVKTLSEIKTLSKFKLREDLVTNYKLTPINFALFKHLPGKSVDLSALDLRKNNINEFRQIMLEIKIEDIFIIKDIMKIFSNTSI